MSDNVPSVNVKVIEVAELLDKMPSSGTRDHKELERACNIASLSIEAMCGGTAFIRRTFTEDHTAGLGGSMGGAHRLYLRRNPIVSVTSITDDDSNTIASTEYTIVTVGNTCSYLEHDSYWPAPIGRWTVIYTAGIWEDTDDVDWDVKEWARIVALRNKSFKGDFVQSSSLSGRAGSRSVSRGNQGLESRSDFENQVLAKYRRRSM